MRYRITAVFLGGFVLFLLTRSANADVITPSSATATSEFGLGIEVANLINGSGLDGMGPVDSQSHDNNNANMWFSGCADAGIPGGTPVDCPTGFEVAPVDEQIIEFELDMAYDLSAALVWNYNELSAIGPLPSRGVKTVDIQVSPDLVSPFQSVGTFELAIANANADPEPAQTVALGDGADIVQRVRFAIQEAHHGTSQDYVGLSEVRFDGVVVPEPGALLVLAEVGLLLLLSGSMKRRGRRH